MTIKNFTTYKCDTCRRLIDIDNDPSHSKTEIFRKSKDDRFIDVSQINKCIITLGCEGKLYPIEQKNTRNVSRTTPHSDVEDWIKRGKQIQASTVVEEEKYISLATNNDNKLTFAIKNTSIPSGNIKITLKKHSSVAFNEYKYSITTVPVHSISGSDNYLKNLLFTVYDSVKVYFNGIELQETMHWNRISLFNNGVYDKIEFIPAIWETGTLKILVSHQELAETINIPFTQHNGVTFDTSWSNIKKIHIASDEYYLYSMVLNNIPINSFFSLQPNSVEDGYIILSDCKFLLSYAPHSIKDRNYAFVVPFENLVNELIPTIKYYNIKTDYYIQTNINNSIELNSPIRINLNSDIFNIDNEFIIPNEQVNGIQNQQQFVSNLIIGQI